MSDPPTDTVHRERPNLADFDPGSLGQPGRLTFESQREAGTRFLACHRQRDDSPGSLVENVVAENKYRALAGLLASPDRIEVSPTNLASQYSGHESSGSARPSSARRFSWAGLSFAASRANRVRAKRCSLSAKAASIAWLRLRKRCCDTKASTCSSKSASMVNATLVLGMAV